MLAPRPAGGLETSEPGDLPIHVPERHTALGDALATALIFQRLMHRMEEAGWKSLSDLIEVAGVR